MEKGRWRKDHWRTKWDWMNETRSGGDANGPEDDHQGRGVEGREGSRN